jgi:hypothetical protein
LPRSISWSEVEQILRKVDRRSPVGKRLDAPHLMQPSLFLNDGRTRRSLHPLSRPSEKGRNLKFRGFWMAVFDAALTWLPYCTVDTDMKMTVRDAEHS